MQIRKMFTHYGFIIAVGDLFFLAVSLAVTVMIRYQFAVTREIVALHVEPFFYIFALWIFCAFVIGLYDRSLGSHSAIVWRLSKSHLWTGAIAVAMFYFVPFFSITPKTNLFIFLVLSLVLLSLWRTVVTNSILPKRKICIIGEGADVHELVAEIQAEPGHRMIVSRFVDLGTVPTESLAGIVETLRQDSFDALIIDSTHPKVIADPRIFFDGLLAGISYFDLRDFYEIVFRRVPLSLVNERWFIEHMNAHTQTGYQLSKRAIDIICSLCIVPVYALLLPFVWCAVYLEDRGPLFVKQERIGKYGKQIWIKKIRTMRGSDAGKWVEKDDMRVTRVGRFLRKTRIDELPQIFSVLKGDISLIGPRPDISGLGKELQSKLPYYSVRTLVSPGLSGWAQVSQDYAPQSLEETRLRLAYDFYYIKNRSIALECSIILKTIRTLLSRVGV